MDFQKERPLPDQDTRLRFFGLPIAGPENDEARLTLEKHAARMADALTELEEADPDSNTTLITDRTSDG